MENTTRANRLINEKSPYLQQHAYNPVDWYAWGEEPFRRALEEDKPVFLSIGYSTCHWCHVMEEESFENDDIAAILNDHFIAIKVDREERPDVDQIYMLATQAMTGAGGWPMSVFLFGDKKPFYAGTYFPQQRRHNHPGFAELLQAISQAWRDNRKGLTGSAEKITSFLGSISPQSASQHIDAGWSEIGFQSLRQIYDAEHHGFGTRNKFPRPATFSFLHAYGRRTGNEEAIAMARETLTAMAEGGMYDHLGGGFHRYSVDRLWRIPHFEKMLYDQAQLVVSYLEMFQLTGTPFFARVAEETIDYVLRDLRDPRGGLYSAEDADSVNPYNQEERGEGAFYLWQADEIEKLLDSDDAQLFLDRYGIEKNGNALEDPAEEFTGRNILYIHTSLAELAAERDMRITAVRESLDRSKAALFAQREQRIRPFLDDKILTSWNGLMLSALARAGRILGKSRYLKEAETVASFILENLMVDGRLLRRWRDGEARFDAVLEDYAFFIQGLLDLYDATHNCAHLRKAIDLSSQQIDLFADSDGGFFTSQEKPDLLTRMKETHDGAEPSGNSVAALNFLRLGRMLSQAKWTTTAEKTIRTFGSELENQGSAMVLMLAALELSLHPPTQLVIAGNTSSPDTQALLTQVQRRYLPQLQVLLADRGENQHFLLQYIDHIGGMTRIENKSTAYLCKDYSCQAPTINPQKLAELLEQIS